MIRFAAAIVAVASVASVASVAACGGDAPTAASTTVPCGGCRRLDTGTDARLGDVSFGVSLCHDGQCSLAIVADDGTESHRTAHPGDVIEGWRVVSVDGSGLVVGPG